MTSQEAVVLSYVQGHVETHADWWQCYFLKTFCFRGEDTISYTHGNNIGNISSLLRLLQFARECWM